MFSAASGNAGLKSSTAGGFEGWPREIEIEIEIGMASGSGSGWNFSRALSISISMPISTVTTRRCDAEPR
jgi:hypothetical protein